MSDRRDAKLDERRVLYRELLVAVEKLGEAQLNELRRLHETWDEMLREVAAERRALLAVLARLDAGGPKPSS